VRRLAESWLPGSTRLADASRKTICAVIPRIWAGTRLTDSQRLRNAEVDEPGDLPFQDLLFGIQQRCFFFTAHVIRSYHRAAHDPGRKTVRIESLLPGVRSACLPKIIPIIRPDTRSSTHGPANTQSCSPQRQHCPPQAKEPRGTRYELHCSSPGYSERFNPRSPRRVLQDEQNRP